MSGGRQVPRWWHSCALGPLGERPSRAGDLEGSLANAAQVITRWETVRGFVAIDFPSPFSFNLTLTETRKLVIRPLFPARVTLAPRGPWGQASNDELRLALWDAGPLLVLDCAPGAR